MPRACRAGSSAPPCWTLPGVGRHACPAAQITQWGVPLPSHSGSTRVAPWSASALRNAAAAMADRFTDVADRPVATSGNEQHGGLDGTGGLASAGSAGHKACLTRGDRLRPVFL